ncbi:hypothetical protein KUTeg_004074 [Tegillarca granosa]|uniref:Protein N-terminal asparagine amidohydrolase n=1 Tax=Tegillarca granosa TaxID=220873 RepID=A0ABQ9FP14_TEGGR|nr:hypothetical protein KUTeg_004074 [Tegillarca granosa]
MHYSALSNISVQQWESTAEAFCKQKPRTVSEIGLLYVGQREMAGTTPEDDTIETIGTEDATTCHMVVLRHTGSGAVCVSHFDGCGTEKAVNDMIDIVNNLSSDKPQGRLELHLFGGFCDDDETSRKLSKNVIKAFHQSKEEIYLMTACISDWNNVRKERKSWPIVYGIAVNVLNIYDPKSKLLKIGPFEYTTIGEIEILCGIPDRFLLENFSTSPDQEPTHFIDNVRAALKQIRDHPDPMKTVFKNGKPRCYRLQSDGKWTKADP